MCHAAVQHITKKHKDHPENDGHAHGPEFKKWVEIVLEISARLNLGVTFEYAFNPNNYVGKEAPTQREPRREPDRRQPEALY